LLRNSNSVVLNGKPLDQDIATALGQPVRLENDANCLAISEAIDGAGAGCPVVFGAILGTGVGGGIVVKGHILTGLNRIGGEWGHNPLPWATEGERPGYRCYCGKHGCIETFLSGAGLTREYFSLSQKELRAEEIAAADQAGEPTAVRSLVAYKHRLGAIRSDFGLMAAAVSALLGGIVVWGSNTSKEIAAAESERAALIDNINPRVI
jgi:fructokinase